MSIKSIVVHVDSGKATPARLDVALALATEHGAHLVGIHPRDLGMLPFYVEPSAGLIEQQQRWVQEEAAQSREMFEKRTGSGGVSAEWRETDGSSAAITAMNGRYSDLVVVGQTDPDNPVFGTPASLPEDVALAVGRPVLVVPYIGGPTAFRRVLVGWNASREATRAVNDALPILRKAERVTVLAVNPEGGPDGHGESPAADICHHLARHGVKAEAAYQRAEDIKAGDLLLSQAFDMSADLIVMGAYGQSRLREMVLGGATRTMLQHMTVPVLLSH